MDGGKDLKRNPALRISLLLIAFLLTSVWLFATEPEIGEMVLVERGTFIMGDASENAEHGERPAHVVTLTYDFFIGKYEVTFDQYDVFCDATGRSRSGDRDWGRGLMPAINVSWWDAIAYCNWLSENEELPLAYDINGNFSIQMGTSLLIPLRWRATDCQPKPSGSSPREGETRVTTTPEQVATTLKT